MHLLENPEHWATVKLEKPLCTQQQCQTGKTLAHMAAVPNWENHCAHGNSAKLGKTLAHTATLPPPKNNNNNCVQQQCHIKKIPCTRQQCRTENTTLSMASSKLFTASRKLCTDQHHCSYELTVHTLLG